MLNFREDNVKVLKFLGYEKHQYLWIAPLNIAMCGFPKSVWEGDNSDSHRFHEDWNLIHLLLNIIKKHDKFSSESWRFNSHGVFDDKTQIFNTCIDIINAYSG